MIIIPEQSTNQLLDQSFVELAAFVDVLQSVFPGVKLLPVDINKLSIYFRNPMVHRKELIKLSKYYYNANGIVTDCYDTFKSLPLLNKTIMWNNMDQKTFELKKTKVDKFIEDIDVVKLARDTIFQVMNEGVCVWYNRDNKFIQFLEPEQYVMEFMINGRWQVYYDLNYIYEFYAKSRDVSITELQKYIESAPDEVTLDSYLRFRKNMRDKTYRYVPLDINKTHVIKFRGSRNDPYALPYCIPALPSIMHKDLLERTERAVANRIINQIIVQKVGNIPTGDGKNVMPAPKELVDGYHEALKKLLNRKVNFNDNDNTNVAALTVRDFVTLDTLKVNVAENIFPKEVYERIDRDIYNKLGYSQSLSSGGGDSQSYGSATINVGKVSAYIFNIIEQVEEGLNFYMRQLVPSGKFNPKIRFSRTTYLNQDDEFKRAGELYLKGRGSLKHYVESAGYDFDHYLSQTMYENEILKLDDVLKVHTTSFTATDNNSGGRPEGDGKNDETSRNRGSGGNNTPSPSDNQ